MHQMEEAWSMNISEEFNSSCITVLDKIIMGWFNKCAPQFICVGRKPHLYCNESHTIGFGLTSIVCRENIVEGKYHPENIGEK